MKKTFNSYKVKTKHRKVIWEETCHHPSWQRTRLLHKVPTGYNGLLYIYPQNCLFPSMTSTHLIHPFILTPLIATNRI